MNNNIWNNNSYIYIYIWNILVNINKYIYKK